MGLDIYLYTADQAAASDAHDKAIEELHAEVPDGKSRYDAMTEDERRAWHAEHRSPHHLDVPSVRYPEHYWNRRYMRSSYNGSGFNHAVPEMIGTSDGSYPSEYGSLGWIFEPARLDDQYEIELTSASLGALHEAKDRALRVAAQLRTCDRLRVFTVSPNFPLSPPEHTDDDALRLYRARVAERPIEADSWWSSRDMTVFGDGVSILAAIPGKAMFGVQGVHLIYRAADQGIDSYIESAEIAAEFCDEATSLIERDGSCSMTWSG